MRCRQSRSIVILAAALVTLTSAAPSSTPGDARRERVPIQLGESRPLETALGDTTLPTAASVWVDMIDGAKSDIALEHFYLSRKAGEALDPVLDAIGRAARRGVKVRLLLDAGMHRTYPQPADSLGTLPGVSVRFVDYRRLAGGVQHAKFMIVDGRQAWLGSQNLDWRALSHIHELGARVEIEGVARAFADVFETDWRGSDTTHIPAPVAAERVQWPLAFQQDGERGLIWASASPQKLNPRSVLWDRDVLVERVNSAQREIVGQVLSYGVGGHGTSDSTLHRVLIAAAARGVQVKLIVSDWVVGGRGEADLRALAALPNVHVRISNVPEWSVGYIPFARVEHCKFMVADSEWLWLGTSNWDPSYFFSSRNIAVTMHHLATAKRVRAIFETSWTAPSAVELKAGTKLEKRIHGETAPPGATMYGE